MTILDWMEQSGIGVWVSTSPAGYYIMLAFHSVGLAMLVGVVTIIDLRLLGVFPIPAASLQRLLRFAWWGFWINAVSGVLVFFSEANKMFYDTMFRWKIALVFVGVIAMIVMDKTVLRPLAATQRVAIGREALDTQAKAQAVFSLLVWAAVIVVGRMIAYITNV